MKQQIEIDVPDGFEVETITQYSHPGDITVICNIEKKQPEFIEVREYLHKRTDGGIIHDSVQKGVGLTPLEAEEKTLFHKWIDHDWRKVEV